MDDEFLDMGFINNVTDKDFDELKDDDDDNIDNENPDDEDDKEKLESDENDDDSEENKSTKKKTKDAETDDYDDLDDIPGSVIVEKSETVGKKEDKSQSNGETDESSPNQISSIAIALKEVGALHTLDDDTLKKIKNVDDFVDVIKNEVKNQLDERQKRIDEAINYDVQPNLVRQYQSAIDYFDNVNEEKLVDEEDKDSIKMRKNLIYQSYIIRGFSKDEAVDMVDRSFDSGKDITDAQKALSYCKKFYETGYNNVIENAKKKQEDYKNEAKKRTQELRENIVKDDDFYKQLNVDEKMRNRIFDAVAKPIYDDGKNGKITEFEKFIRENPNDAYKLLGTVFVLTDGGKDINKLLKNSTKKIVSKSMKNLEDAINGTTRNRDGSFKIQSGVSADTTKFNINEYEPL